MDFTLDLHITKLLLGKANEALQTKVLDILHAVILLSFVKTFRDRLPPVIYQEGHGREPWSHSLDISETVGWFTTIWPTLVHAEADYSLIDVVRQTKDTLRLAPANGWCYFTSLFLHPEGRGVLEIGGLMEISLNYHGSCRSFEKNESILQVVHDTIPIQTNVDSHMVRDEVFAIDVWLAKESFRFDFTYSKNCQLQDSIREWISTCEELLGLAAEKSSQSSRQYTLSDFPQLPLKYPELSKFVRSFYELGVDLACVEGAYPCTAVQQGILLSKERDDSLYGTRSKWKILALDLNQTITIDRVEKAWFQMVTKHSALRTVFVDSVSGTLHDQVVVVNGSGRITITDLHDSSKEKNKSGFLPWHLTITRVSKTEILCELGISHALVDGASIQLIGIDLSCAVNGHDIGGERLSYSDYVAYLKSIPSKQNDYWKTYLHDAAPCVFPKLSSSPTGSLPGGLHSKICKINSKQARKFYKAYGFTLSNVFRVA
ncbi:hypothetical protein ANO14919_142730 [Xylariales sp. No.14919]|nr:hypothetical protein ANO14919_142730 [Xylariales sp. No.14919]